MTIQLNISDVILQPELNAAQITITPIFSSVIPDVNKQYVDEGFALKVDKVAGKGLSTEDYTTTEKGKVANVPLNTNAELGLKVDKVEGSSLVPDSEIAKLSDYPEFEYLEFSHENLTDKNSEAAFQHVDTTTVKSTLAEADKVAVCDSVTGEVVLTPKSNLQTDLTTVNQSITNLQNNKADKTQEAWITPTLLNGWVKYDSPNSTTPMYYKDTLGVVHIRGRISGGTQNTPAFSLPLGYRPIFDLRFSIVANDAFGRVWITKTGNMIIYGSNVSVDFGEITFKAEG